MTRHDMDDLIRDELAGKLDPQRGRARKAFDEGVIQPMARQVESTSGNTHNARNVVLICMLMAACVGIGMFIPKLFPDDATTQVPTPPREAVVEAVLVPETYDHTTLSRAIDAGATPTDTGAPGRRVREERLDRYNWIDPQTGGTFTYVIPSTIEKVLEAHQQ